MRGVRGAGNIRIFSQPPHRYRCAVCGRRFSAPAGTPFDRLRTDPAVVTQALTLLREGGPPQAIVAGLGVEARTLAAWQAWAGTHCQAVHADWVAQGRVETPHVQADELCVKAVGQRVGPALALAAESRLWLGGAGSAGREGALRTRGLTQVRAKVKEWFERGWLVAVEGLSSEVSAVQRVFRRPVPTGPVRRPRPEAAPQWRWGQVVKQYQGRRGVATTQRVVRGPGA